jgi:hypothetical protein
MIELSLSVSVLGCAAGIADAESVGATTKVVAANPIKKSRFIKCFLRALSSVLISVDSPDCSIIETQGDYSTLLANMGRKIRARHSR